MKLKFSLVLLFNFSLQYAHNQSYTFSAYSVAQGLSQSQVTALAEDKNGYLWVGTLGGLNCFNGGTFKNFGEADGLFNNRVTALYPHGDYLWIGHEDGFSVYNKRKFKCWTLPNNKNSVSVSEIVRFQNRLVIATNGEGLYLFSDNKIENRSLNNSDRNRVRSMLVVGDKLYLATRAGLLVTKDLKKFELVKSNLELNLTDVVKRNSDLILATADGKLIKYQPDKQKYTVLYSFPEGDFIYDCFVDSKKQIWFTTELGLSRYDFREGYQLINESSGLPLNSVSCLFEDVNQTLWIGSEGKGMFRFSGMQLTYYNKRTGFLSDLVTSISQLPDHRYVYGTYDMGLIFTQNGSYLQRQLPNNTVWATDFDEQGQLWVGTSNGINKIQNFRTVEELRQGEKISCIYKEKNGQLLCGGSFGLLRIEGGKIYELSGTDQQTEVGTIRQITRFNERLLCAADGGVFEFSSGKFKRILNFSSSVNSIHVDEVNNLWIGTENGLYWSNGKDRRRVFLSDQAASNLIYFLNSKEDRLLVGTNNGLFVLTDLLQKDKAKTHYFGLEEGLINLETNYNSGYFDHKGNFWFGTAEGMMRLDLSKPDLLSLEGRPFLQINSIKINFQNIDYTKYSSKFYADGMPANLQLPPNKNNLILELDGISLKHHKNLKYQYWLENLDERWSPLFSSPIVTLSNLPSGNYRLHIRSINNAGKTSKEFVMDLRIDPHFYTTWWFYTLNVLFLGLSIYGFLKFRINREREKQEKETLEYKAKLMLLEQQSLNASMNRHFIFNSLNSIQYFINTQDKHSANKYLTNFAKLIRKNLDSSSENNNLVTLSQEMERLELYLSLESMRFKDRFDYEIDTGDVDLEAITVPSMLFQPFVENSIIHGILPLLDRKGLIKIKLSVENSTLTVLIEDNGVGIENSLSKKGKIEGDHESKGMEITTKRIDILKKLSQLEYELIGPFQYEDKNRLISGTRVLIKIPVENLED